MVVLNFYVQDWWVSHVDDDGWVSHVDDAFTTGGYYWWVSHVIAGGYYWWVSHVIAFMSSLALSASLLCCTFKTNFTSSVTRLGVNVQ